MDAFANVEDLAARWRDLSPSEKVRAGVLLVDASAALRSALKNAGIAVDETDALQAVNLKAINCSMVQRAMSAKDDMYGVTQQSMTAGPFTGSATFANATGDLYITRAERKKLGIGRMRAGFLRPKIGVSDASW